MYYIYSENEKNVIVFYDGNESYSFFLEDMGNKDYLEYLKWVEAGNSPQPFIG